MNGKLHRRIAFGGLFAMSILLQGCQAESIKVDLLHSETPLLNGEAFYETIIIAESPQERILGGITTLDEVAQTVQAIPEPEYYKTVAVLAYTDHATPTHQIFTYEDPGVLAGVDFDQETIKSLTDANIVRSLGAVQESSFWNKPFIRQLNQQFPESKILLLSINKDLANPEVAGYALKSHLPEESLVLALANVEQNSHPLINEFHQQYQQEVLKHFDDAHFKDLPVDETVQLEVLGRYLRLRGATNMIENGSPYLFLQGEDDEQPSTAYFVSFGDIMLGRFVRTLMDSNGLDYPFTNMDNDYLRVNDVLIANLEGPITTSAIRTSTGMSFGFFPDTAPLLKKYHFDLLSQANNHTLDKRIAGYEESMNFIRAEGMVPFGHQHEVNEQSVGYANIRGQQFAFLGLEEVNSPINDQVALRTVQDLVAKEYKVIVYPHWGIEYQNRANDRQRNLAHAWIDAGAIAVIGHHPHVIQTYETYKGRPIFYSLGNAVFDQYWSIPTQEGLSIALAINDEATTIYFLPIKIDRSQMRLMNSDEARAQLEKLVQWGDHSEEERQAILSGKLVL